MWLKYFLENIFSSFFSIIKIILQSSFFNKIHQPEISKDCELIILGNGPSLKYSLREHENYFKNKDIMCVNGFALSEYYKILKPKYYVLSAPQFWRKNPTDANISFRESVFEKIRNDTDWELNIFISLAAKKSKYWKAQFITKPNIKIYYYNHATVEGFQFFTHFIFRNNLGMMRQHNVLVPGIFSGINMNYKKIIIFGADHSWHEELTIDENNTVKINHEHFYDQGKVILPMFKFGGSEFKIHDMFYKWYLAFKGYFLLNEYAISKKTTILNASKKSYIDAFKKVKIN
jgi:hypothetical protein